MTPISGSYPVNQSIITPAPEKLHTVTVVLNNSGTDAIFAMKMLCDKGLSVHFKQGGYARVTGTLQQLSEAFAVETGVTEHGHISYRGQIHVHNDLHPHVLAVLGLDTHPVAKPHIRKADPARGTEVVPLEIYQVTSAYGFPPVNEYIGKGQCVAIIELGGGYKKSDLRHFFASCGCKWRLEDIEAVSVDGAVNSPGSDADGEVVLDTEIVGAVATGADISVLFAPNTDAGFYDAIMQAIQHKSKKGHNVSVISISWGGPESQWTKQAMAAMNKACQDAAALGIIITVAAGDSGSDDGVGDGAYHVDFPGSSPYVWCCGGTELLVTGSSTGQYTIDTEVVWNNTDTGNGATGGGVSTEFPGRSVPDMAGDASPFTGYQIYLDDQWQTIGGTSAVAPLIAGLLAQCGSAKGKNGGVTGLTIPRLVAAGAFRKVTSGNNSDDPSVPLYSATETGRDNCTGYGSPIGTKFLEVTLAE